MRISDWSSDVCSSDLRSSPACFADSVTFAVCASTSTKCLRRAVGEDAERLEAAAKATVFRVFMMSPPPVRNSSACLSCTKQRDACQALITKLRSEEHTSELQSLMRISYAVFRMKKK